MTWSLIIVIVFILDDFGHTGQAGTQVHLSRAMLPAGTRELAHQISEHNAEPYPGLSEAP